MPYARSMEYLPTNSPWIWPIHVGKSSSPWTFSWESFVLPMTLIRHFRPCLPFCFLVSCWGAMLIWSPCGNSHLCDCLRWWWTRWKRKPSENGHCRHRRKTANVRNRRIFWFEPLHFGLGNPYKHLLLLGRGAIQSIWFWMFIFFDISFFSPGRTRYLHYRPGLRPWRFWSKRGVPNLKELGFF